MPSSRSVMNSAPPGSQASRESEAQVHPCVSSWQALGAHPKTAGATARPRLRARGVREWPGHERDGTKVFVIQGLPNGETIAKARRPGPDSLELRKVLAERVKLDRRSAVLHGCPLVWVRGTLRVDRQSETLESQCDEALGPRLKSVELAR